MKKKLHTYWDIEIKEMTHEWRSTFIRKGDSKNIKPFAKVIVRELKVLQPN